MIMQKIKKISISTIIGFCLVAFMQSGCERAAIRSSKITLALSGASISSNSIKSLLVLPVYFGYGLKISAADIPTPITAGWSQNISSGTTFPTQITLEIPVGVGRTLQLWMVGYDSAVSPTRIYLRYGEAIFDGTSASTEVAVPLVTVVDYPVLVNMTQRQQ